MDTQRKGLEPTYFTCTLGEASRLNNGRSINRNITNFIDTQASKIPSQPAVGFPVLTDSSHDQTSKSAQVFTFQDVQRGSAYAASVLIDRVQGDGRGKHSEQKTVGLLCPSTAEFLFVWLGLIRLGHAALLIAPQCRSDAIKSLCEDCGAEVLLCDESYKSLAEEASSSASKCGSKLKVVPLPFSVTDESFTKALGRSAVDTEEVELCSESIAYLHHTSGTSSGRPKPVAQSHNAAIGVLPQTLDGSFVATLTSTPLYHGGIADLFRAWTSSAMIWLFPGKHAPITPRNILSCFRVAAHHTRTHKYPEIKYFSSVPYVLQMMASDDEGLKALQQMDMVGVGGAALASEVGDRLVQNHVKLVSRFGSAECGFLISSYRDFANDGAWQYLRCDRMEEFFSFESRDDGLCELIIKPRWPHRAKTNRDDGSYATSDLFERHPSIENAWRYHSRADSQLVLVTGKKFDPSAAESAISSSPLLDDVLVFGSGQPFPGALLFRSLQAKDISDKELLTEVAPLIEATNNQNVNHARLMLDMLSPMPYEHSGLEKSSKGTIIRNQAEKKYHRDIKRAYDWFFSAEASNVKDSQILDFISKKVSAILSLEDDIGKDTDLFSTGVDSVASLQLRYSLQSLLPAEDRTLPMNIVEDCGTVNNLSDYILSRRRGEYPHVGRDDDFKVMTDLVEQFSNFSVPASPSTNGHVASTANSNGNRGDVILITGVTGMLGAHVLHILRNLNTTEHVYCLVRGASDQAVLDRVNKSLTKRGLPALENGSESRVTILRAMISDPQLKLSDSMYTHLTHTVTHIFHLAWEVNFRLRLRSFVKDHIAGTRHMLDLARIAQHQPRFVFCSTTATVSNNHSTTIPEQLSTEPADAAPLGYSRSKWVAERICVAAADSLKPLYGNIRIVRVGQLSGDTEKGIWNAMEAWPLMLSSVKTTGCLPTLGETELDWLPVDIAAQAIVDIGRHEEESSDSADPGPTGAKIFHVLNAQPKSTWRDLLAFISKQEKLNIVSFHDWVRTMENLQENRSTHPALQLLGLWQEQLQRETQNPDASDSGEPKSDVQTSAKSKTYSVKNTNMVTRSLKEMSPMTEEYFDLLWQWVKTIDHHN